MNLTSDFQSGEQYDDGSRAGDLNGTDILTDRCTGKSALWESRENKKARRACAPVLDEEVFSVRAVYENCQRQGDVCLIVKSYQTECARNGANIAMKC